MSCQRCRTGCDNFLPIERALLCHTLCSESLMFGLAPAPRVDAIFLLARYRPLRIREHRTAAVRLHIGPAWRICQLDFFGLLKRQRGAGSRCR